MIEACPAPSPDAGVIRGVLATVDCHTRVYAQSGFEALNGPQSVFPAALTLLLPLYVALLGYRMLFGLGRTQLSQAPLLALKVGVVLSLALNWNTFQTLVFDVALKSPLQLAQTIGAPAARSGSALAADPLGGLQVTYDELGRSASALGRLAGPDPQVLRGGEAAASQALWKAQTALFMSTAGLMAIAIIAVGVLSATGPVFITFFMFDAMRGLFFGWLRALLAAAFVPMLTWSATTLLLVVVEPLLVRLAQGRLAGAPDPQAAAMVSAIIFVFAAAQAALSVGSTVIAGSFQPGAGARNGARALGPGGSAVAAAPPLSRPEQLAQRLRPAAGPSVSVMNAHLVGPFQPMSPNRAALTVSRQDPRSGLYRRDAFLDRYRSHSGDSR